MTLSGTYRFQSSIKLFISFVILLAQSLSIGAQCEFNENLTGPFDFYPNGLEGENFDEGFIDAFYEDNLELIVPTTASDIDPELPPLPLDSLSIESIFLTLNGSDTPIALTDIGLDYTCDNNGDLGGSCFFLSGESYCVTINGMPNQTGIYAVSMDVVIYAELLGQPQVFPYTFDVASLEISEFNCFAADQLIAEDLGDSTYELCWNHDGSVFMYTVQFRECGAQGWTNIGNTTQGNTCFTTLPLDCNTCYEWRVITECDLIPYQSGASTFQTSCSCDPPSALITQTFDVDTEFLFWMGSQNALEYEIEIAPCETNDWVLESSLEDNTYALGDLSCGECFDWRVRSICNGAESEWTVCSPEERVETAPCICTAPEDLSTFTATESSVNLDWENIAGADAYLVQYKCCDDLSWIAAEEVISSSTYALGGLECNSCYNWRVRVDCEDADWSESGQFLTLDSEECNTFNCEFETRLNEKELPEINVYFNGSDIIVQNPNELNYLWELFDMQGRPVSSGRSTGSGQKSLQVSGFIKSSMYILRIKVENEYKVMKIFVQQD